jgi:HK97 family phage major capsid protein
MMTQARVAEYPVDGVVLHPNDWEKMRLMKTEDGGTTNKGNYVFGDPGRIRYRGCGALRSLSLPRSTAGFALVGAFGLGAEIFDRQEATIDISTEHSDYFVKNIVAIRAEERLALGGLPPGGFHLRRAVRHLLVDPSSNGPDTFPARFVSNVRRVFDSCLNK